MKVRSGIVLLAIVSIFAAITCHIALAGALGGPQYADETVLARGTDVYKIVFKGGELASVIVTGDGDVDLYIYDPAGSMIRFDARGTYAAECYWTPQATGLFTLKIINCEHRVVAYRIQTN